MRDRPHVARATWPGHRVTDARWRTLDPDLGLPRARRTDMATTPWGLANVVEGRKQRGEDDRELSTIVQLLENERGETLVRFAYSTDDQVRRGPVTLRESDLLKLRKALAKRPRLHAALHWRA